MAFFMHSVEIRRFGADLFHTDAEQALVVKEGRQIEPTI